MKTILRNTLLVAAIASAGIIAGCDGLEANTYQAPGGLYSLEFQSGGKAIETFGPIKQKCTWAQNGNNVSVTCDAVTVVFAFNPQGQLVAKPDSILGDIGPLTKKQ
jgi:hypothetical protein